MNDKRDKISAVFADRSILEKALAQVIQKALLPHKRIGNPVVVEREGKVVEIPPEEIPDLPIEDSLRLMNRLPAGKFLAKLVLA